MSLNNLNNKLTTIFLCLTASFFIFLAYTVNFYSPVPNIKISKEQSALNLSPDFVQLFTFGHSRLISSILWITTMLESDIEHYKGKKNSWIYHRFISISRLEPKFYQNYIFGGQYLSIIKDDILGADTLYQLGISKFPTDFWLYFYAGFNASFEMNDQPLGLTYYSKIIDHPQIQKLAPNLITLYRKLQLHNKVLTKDEVFENLKVILATAKGEALKNKLKFDLYSLKAEKDLTCLNQGRSNCDKFDFLGNEYLMDKKQWTAVFPWKIYQLNKRD